MANNQAFKIKNGLSAKRYLQNSTAVSASDVDLSTGSYFTKTLSANTTFTFSNPPASGKAMGFALEVTGADVTVGYDLANASYDSKSFSVASQETTPQGLAFKSDGTKMYIVGSTGDDVNQYSLSTAWDVSTASFDSVAYSVATEDTTPVDIEFKPDGTKMYILGQTGDTVDQYSLSTAWDVSTASYDSVSFSVASQENTPTAFMFSSDGTKMYVIGLTNSTVYQYTLSTAWDASTLTYASKSFSLSTQGTDHRGLDISSDGTSFISVNRDTDTAHSYSLSTAYDITTASFSASYTFSEDTIPFEIKYKSDGEKLYMLGNSNDAIYQYSTSASAIATVAWPSSVKWSGATAPDAPASGEKDVYVFVTTDGGTTYYGKQAGDAVA